MNCCIGGCHFGNHSKVFGTKIYWHKCTVFKSLPGINSTNDRQFNRRGRRMDALKGEYCVVYIYNANKSALALPHTFLSRENPSKSWDNINFLTLIFALLEKKKSIASRKIQRFQGKTINLCEFLQRVKTGLSSLVNDYKSLIKTLTFKRQLLLYE